jgi:putative transposase
MPYQHTSTHCIVRLVALRGLASTTLAQCQALRAEAGRLWTELVFLHAQARAQGRWLGAGELEQATKGGQYALHSQSVPALCQKFVANVDTVTELRRQEMSELGHVQTAYPHHAKVYQTVVWKNQALQVLPTGQVRLPTRTQRPPLLLPLPEEYRLANLRRAELTWRADHYELCLTVDTSATLPHPLPAGAVAGVDLGEVHVAAVTTTRRHALVVSGRQLRACKQWRNKVHRVLPGAAEPLPARISPSATPDEAESPGERQTLPAATGPAASGGAQSRGLLRRGRSRSHCGGGGA